MNNHYEKVQVLLVEDTPTDAELCIRSLRKYHLANEIAWVKDGAEALDFLFGTGAYAGNDPTKTLKVVLLDLRLPKVDGIQVLRTLKADNRTKQIPVVVLTSSKETHDVAECYALGVNSFISKPVEFTEFSDVVSKLGMYWLLVNHPPVVA